MSRHELEKTLPWLAEGTGYLLRTVDGLTDEQFGEPSALSGWTRAHVVGHLARNADALARLANWARTGVENPMYASLEARGVEIEETAKRPVPTVRAELTDTAASLDAELAALDEASWRAEVRSAQGRSIPALEVPWMRVREVWLHSVDLDVGAGFADFPAELLAELLDDVSGFLSQKDDCPAVSLRSDEGPSAVLGAGDQDTVHGPLAALAGWLTGRLDGTGLHSDSGALPTLPRWL